MAALTAPAGPVQITVMAGGGLRRVQGDDLRAAQAAARDLPGFQHALTYTYVTPVRMFGRCVGCRERFVVQDVVLEEQPGQGLRPCQDDQERLDGKALRDCPDGRGHTIRWDGLKATRNSTVCSAKCQESASPTCRCSCAGAEHGRLA